MADKPAKVVPTHTLGRRLGLVENSIATGEVIFITMRMDRTDFARIFGFVIET